MSFLRTRRYKDGRKYPDTRCSITRSYRFEFNAVCTIDHDYGFQRDGCRDGEV